MENASADTMDDASSVESGGSDYDEDDSGSTSDTSERRDKQEGINGAPTRVSGESSSASGGESDEKMSNSKSR